MAINPIKELNSAIDKGNFSVGSDGVSVIQSGEAEIKLIESDPKHAGFDGVEIVVGGEVKKYSWQASPGLFKRLNDFVEHKKAVASGGVTSELGTKREHKVQPVQISSASRVSGVLSEVDIMQKYLKLCSQQAGLGEEIREDLERTGNKSEREGMIDDMRTVVENFEAIKSAIKNDPVRHVKQQDCDDLVWEIDKAIRHFRSVCSH